MNLDAKANATIITSNEALYHTWYTSLFIYDGVFLRGAQKTRKKSNRMFFADVIQWFVKTPNHAVFGGCTYHRRNGVLPKNGKDPVENHQQKPQNEDIITLWSRTIPTPSQPGFPCCTLNYSWPLSPTSSVFSTNPMVDVKHFSFQQLCAKLAVGACEANVQLNYTRSRVE